MGKTAPTAADNPSVAEKCGPEYSPTSRSQPVLLTQPVMQPVAAPSAVQLLEAAPVEDAVAAIAAVAAGVQQVRVNVVIYQRST